MSGHAVHIASPSSDENGAMNAMRYALQCANRDPSEVGYVNADVAGTIKEDAVERSVIAWLLLKHKGENMGLLLDVQKGPQSTYL